MLRVGTVGTSSIMRTIQEAIRLTDGMECRVVYSRTEEQGRAFAAEMGVPEHCTDYAAMLEREEARRAAKEVKTPDVIPMPGTTEDSSAGNSEIPPEGKPRSGGDGELPH